MDRWKCPKCECTSATRALVSPIWDQEFIVVCVKCGTAITVESDGYRRIPYI